jgi:hypothetical protein
MTDDDMSGSGIVSGLGVRPAFWISLNDKLIEGNNLHIEGKSTFSDSNVIITFGEWKHERLEYYSECMGREPFFTKDKEAMPIEWEIVDYDAERKKILL